MSLIALMAYTAMITGIVKTSTTQYHQFHKNFGPITKEAISKPVQEYTENKSYMLTGIRLPNAISPVNNSSYLVSMECTRYKSRWSNFPLQFDAYKHGLMLTADPAGSVNHYNCPKLSQPMSIYTRMSIHVTLKVNQILCLLDSARNATDCLSSSCVLL